MVVMVMNIMVIRTEKKARKTITHWSHNIDVDDEDPVGNSLLQIWKLRFGHKDKLLFRFWAESLVKIWSWNSGKILKLEFGVFCCWFLVDVTKLNLGQVKILKLALVKILSLKMLMFGWDFEVNAKSRFWNWNLI